MWLRDSPYIVGDRAVFVLDLILEHHHRIPSFVNVGRMVVQRCGDVGLYNLHRAETGIVICPLDVGNGNRK